MCVWWAVAGVVSESKQKKTTGISEPNVEHKGGGGKWVLGVKIGKMGDLGSLHSEEVCKDSLHTK